MRVIIAVSLLLLTGCSNSTATDGCRIFKPIYGAKADTPETRSQVDTHNARGVGACGWKP